MYAWRRLSGIFSPSSYSSDRDHEHYDPDPKPSRKSPRPSRVSLHHGHSSYGQEAHRKRERRDELAIPEHPSDSEPPSTEIAEPEPAATRTSGSRSRSATVSSTHAQGKEEDMPPERRGTGSRKSFDRFRRNHESKTKVNAHEIWMDRDRDARKDKSEGKEREREKESRKKSDRDRDRSQPVKSKPLPTPSSSNAHGSTPSLPSHTHSPAQTPSSSRLTLLLSPKSKSSSKSETIKHLTSTNASLTAQLRTLEERDAITQSSYRALQSEVEGLRAERTLHETQHRVLQSEVDALRRKSAQDDEEILSLLRNGTRATEAAARHIEEVEARGRGLEEQVRRWKERAGKAEAAASAAATQLQQLQAHQAGVNGHGVANGMNGTGRMDVDGDDGGAIAEEVFRSKADKYAGAEIIRMIENLNAEILQFAAFVGEAVVASDSRIPDEQRVVDKCRKRCAERVGTRLCEAVKKAGEERGEKDPFPLQLALQHAVIVWGCYIVQAFTPENKELNGQLAGIWGRISMREDPAVAGKWRAIIAGQLHGPSTLYRAIFDDCKYIMVAGGWSTKSPTASTLSANIQARLMAVEASMMKLKEAVNEGVTSTEIVPALCAPGTPYDEREMDSAYPDAEDARMVGRGVVCTVDLGLKKLVATRKANGSLDKKYEVLLKPKVILPTALDDSEEA